MFNCILYVMICNHKILSEKSKAGLTLMIKSLLKTYRKFLIFSKWTKHKIKNTTGITYQRFIALH